MCWTGLDLLALGEQFPSVNHSPLTRVQEWLQQNGIDWVRSVEVAGALVALGTAIFGFFSGIGTIPIAIIGGIIVSIASFELGIRYEAKRREESGVAIEGCVEMSRGALYSGKLFVEGNKWDHIEVSDSATCSDCRTQMEGKNTRVFNNSSYFECPSCGQKTDFHSTSEAEKRLKKHFENIYQTKNEQHSYQTLKENLRKQEKNSTPRQIWKAYAETTSDSEVSTDCFP